MSFQQGDFSFISCVVIFIGSCGHNPAQQTEMSEIKFQKVSGFSVLPRPLCFCLLKFAYMVVGTFSLGFLMTLFICNLEA